MELLVPEKKQQSSVPGITLPLDNPRLSEFTEEILASPKLKKANIINLINHLNFSDGYIIVHLSNIYTEEETLTAAYPDPCVDDTVTCRWADRGNPGYNGYTVKNILINEGKFFLVVPVEDVSITEESFCAVLPVRGYKWRNKDNVKFFCQDLEIKARVNNEDIGVLKYFNSSTLCVKLAENFLAISDRIDIDADIPYYVKLYSENGGTCFSGYCDFVRLIKGEDEGLVLFAPYESYSNFSRRENRNPRLKLKPTPRIILGHPFMTKSVMYEAEDISTAGFSIYIDNDESVLIPGIIFDYVTIIFSNNIQIQCSAKIVYQKRDDYNQIKYGFSIIDMSHDSFNSIFSILSNTENPHINLSYNLDLEELWSFFFKSRFIYPKKYTNLAGNNKKLKETYRNLYHKGQEVFTSITYQKNSKIYGHCSLIKAYQKSWLVHHLAAVSANNGMPGTGLVVLNQVLKYVDTLFQLPSSDMEYLMFYYQETNRFSNYFFGGFAEEVNDRKIVSVDRFGYFQIDNFSLGNNCVNRLNIEQFTDQDKIDLHNSFNSFCDGLSLDALGINLANGNEQLSNSYNDIGLKRESRIFSLKEHNELKAIAIVDTADEGINMSELLNNLKVIVVDSSLSWEKLYNTLCLLGRIYKKDKISIMIYPESYIISNEIAVDRYYNLWVVNSEYGYEYNNFLKQRVNP